jgi:transposase
MSYSLLGACKLHKMNPQEWLHDVFKKLPERKANHMDDLLPQNWKVLTQDVV